MQWSSNYTMRCNEDFCMKVARYGIVLKQEVRVCTMPLPNTMYYVVLLLFIDHVYTSTKVMMKRRFSTAFLLILSFSFIASRSSPSKCSDHK